MSMRRVLESIDFKQSLNEKKAVAYKASDKKNPTANQCMYLGEKRSLYGLFLRAILLAFLPPRSMLD